MHKLVISARNFGVTTEMNTCNLADRDKPLLGSEKTRKSAAAKAKSK